MTDLILNMLSRNYIVVCFYSVVSFAFFDGMALFVAPSLFLSLPLSQSRTSSPYLIPHGIQFLSQMVPNPFCFERNFFASSFIVNVPKQ